MNKILKKCTALLISLLCLSCSSKSELSGYIEGEYTYIASGVAGTLFKLYVIRGQNIKNGDLLYQLDPEPEKAHVDMIKENIKQLQAELIYNKSHYERQLIIFKKNGVSKDDLELAKSNYESKAKQLAAAQDQLIQVSWALQQKTISCPVTGRIFDTFYREGEKVPENKPVLAVLAPKNIKVLFYVPERILSQIQLGKTISFICDSCKEKTNAVISYISPEAEYTPPIIYSKDSRDKLVYLIRAEMPEDVARNFHPGQPITVYLK